MTKPLLSYILLMLPFISGAQFYNTVYSSSNLQDTGNFVFNHASSIIKIGQGTVLKNGDTLQNNRLLVSAYGGLGEGYPDQTVWYSISNDNGLSWSQPDTLTTFEETTGDSTTWNMDEYINTNGQIIKFYFQQPGKGGGSGGKFPLWLKTRISDDGGISWSQGKFRTINGITDSSKFRIMGFFEEYIPIGNDTLAAPIYYRIVGDRVAYFGFLRFSKDLTYFKVDTTRAFSQPETDGRIEPSGVLFNNKIYVFFRTSSGTIDYIESSDMGNTWSAPAKTGIITPSTKSTFFVYNNKLHAVTNLNIWTRNNLSVIELDSLFQPEKVLTVDVLNDDFQVSYPSIHLDGDDLHISYTRAYFDKTSHYRRSDIQYTRVDMKDLKTVNKVFSGFRKPAKSTQVKEHFVSAATNDMDEHIFAERKGRLQMLENYSWSPSPVIDTTVLYRALTFSTNDTAVVSSTSGLFRVYAGNSASDKYGNAGLVNTLHPLSNGQVIGSSLNALRLYSPGGVVQSSSIPFSGPSTQFSGSFNTISDFLVVSHDSIFYLMSDGRFYFTSDTVKQIGNGVLLSPSIIDWGDRLFYDEDSVIYVTSHTGKMVSYNIYTGSTASITQLYSHSIMDMAQIGDSTYFIGGGMVWQLDSTGLSLDTLYYDNSGKELLKIVELTSDSISAVDVFGSYYTFPLNSKNISTPERKELERLAFIYPNPFENSFHVNYSGRYDLKLVGITGDLIQEIPNCVNNTELSFKSLPNGLYFLILNPESQPRQVIKVLKK
ncbi:MAG: exo-alpha-sialidase [Owenweeksia sp.]